MQILQQTTTNQTLELENEIFMVPKNCWAYDADTHKLITTPTIQAIAKTRIRLVPKIAGG